MKKLLSIMLGLSLVIGSASFVFAQDAPAAPAEETKKEGKKKGKKKKAAEGEKSEDPAKK